MLFIFIKTKQMKSKFISHIVNSKEMFSRIGATTSYFLNPVKRSCFNKKEKQTKTEKEKQYALFLIEPKEEINIFDNKQQLNVQPIKSTSPQNKSNNKKDHPSMNLISTSPILYFPKDHIFPHKKAYYSFTIKENKPKIRKEDYSKSPRYYIDHDTFSLHNKKGTIDFSKMTTRKNNRNKIIPKLNPITETINTYSSTIKTITEDSINSSFSSPKKTAKPKPRLSKKKNSIPRTLEYNPRYDFIHPRSMTFVNYSSQETENEKSITLRDKGIPYVCNKNNVKQDLHMKNRYMFDFMKGRIKEGINPKYPSYMYCLYNKFGVEQTSDVSLKMNNYEDGVYLKQGDLLKQKSEARTQRNNRKLFDFMKNNRIIYDYLHKRQNYFSVKY